MELRFPLNDVRVTRVNKTHSVEFPLYVDSYWQMNQKEFAMQVNGVADFYACDGHEIEYAPVQGAEDASIELYLNGSVYGAVLHQRKIMPFHGSSFRYNEVVIMVCGDTGAGKSSLTASFCLDGAEFLTDDITPVIMRDGFPNILALSDRIKLWSDALLQLGRKESGLERIHPEMDKYYYPVSTSAQRLLQLNLVFFITVGEDGLISIKELKGKSLFSALREHIYRPEYLNGMTDNEREYFANLIAIGNNIRAWSVDRSSHIGISTLAGFIRARLDSILSGNE